MEIKKLLTLSNFVQYLRQFTFNELRNLDLAEKFRRVIKYDYFIKQSPKKEMFVNEIVKPEGMHLFENASSWALNASEVIECQEWQKAEKQVIFEGFVIVRSKSKKDNLTLTNGDIFISIAFKDEFIYYSKNDYAYAAIETLHELAYKTNCELKLKNAQI